MPWKDTFWSRNGPQPGNHWGPLTAETAAPLEAAVSVLSSGPVGPSDCATCLNRTNILRTCTAEGRLLHPSRPATAVDATFTFRSFGGAGPDGELWQTYSEVGGMTWGTVLAATLWQPFVFGPEVLQIPLLGPVQNASFFAWRDGDPSRTLQPFHAVSLPALQKTAFQLWHLAPAFSTEGGASFVVLGEVAKFVPMSPIRFVSASADSRQGTLRLSMAGGPSEQVTVQWMSLPDRQLHSATCTLAAWGRGSLLLPSGTCSQQS